MTANDSVNIEYWRWTVPPVTASPVLGPPQRLMPGDHNLPEVKDLNQTELLREDKAGIMPKVEDILKVDGSGELCRELVKKFFLPEFFFRRLGWNANGMFGSAENLSQTDKESSYDLRDWKKEPFLMLESALSIVVDQCEEDLWSFQKPVRDIEKTRGQEVFKQTSSFDNDETFEFLVKRYTRLHELSRHVIHISETMDAASSNLGAIVRDHDLWTRSNTPSSAATKRLSKALLLRENMIHNLNFRAKAFVGRMDNEIKCASNFVAVADSNISKGILKQTRNEGKVLSDTVSALTLLFLPSTFISGFFGMNFFTLESNQTTQKLQWETHPKIWIFFVCAIPITILGFFIFMIEFNLVVWIQDMQAFIRDIFCQGTGPDPENPSPRSSIPSDKPRRSYRSFGFSRRASLRPTP
ncbi:Mg2+ transporter protein, CorA-like/Zinc transport protein ZntB [Penicillium expansum]|uniref:Mg2+ transporter protein, CorA-like/Zinc transport protein ZntB n=1 Tax=Penicillium expansum TaxID=27334 RepID=A0A0A2JEU1_PENEN|nr:Mg2+ transporter protein, CorA-like/Zinc transport protein ZntB [Penicillium expansum]KGO39068.1 Mg2+ transporter protein, CorA-like/Zinc transport protein ZntB [Penicillium expansum]KGO53947.1 Mg2+ transporter protein, CorA-like/Zinc transport protein ZntB [Penicillium expansum]